MGGIIEDEIEFSVPSLPPFGNSYKSQETIRLDFTVYSIRLTPKGLDALTSSQIGEIFDDPQKFKDREKWPTEISIPETMDQPVPCRMEVSGVWENVEVLAPNGGTETKSENDFMGESSRSSQDTCFASINEQLEFGLLQDGPHITYCLRSKKGYQSRGQAEDLERFQSFLTALGYFYAKNAWPMTKRYWRDGKLCVDEVRAPDEYPGGKHRPFPQAVWFNIKVGQVEGDFADFFALAYDFFEQRTVLSETVSQILFYVREATKDGVHNAVSVYSLCALVENLMKAICKDRIRRCENLSDLTDLLDTYGVRSRKLDSSRPIMEVQEAVIMELGKSKWSAEQVFHLATDVVELDWDKEWNKFFINWRDDRNLILHDGGHELSREEQNNQLHLESRLVGAINIYVARLFGYRGIICKSTYEDKYTKI